MAVGVPRQPSQLRPAEEQRGRENTQGKNTPNTEPSQGYWVDELDILNLNWEKPQDWEITEYLWYYLAWWKSWDSYIKSNLIVYWLSVGGNRSTRRKPTQTQGQWAGLYRQKEAQKRPVPSDVKPQCQDCHLVLTAQLPRSPFFFGPMSSEKSKDI